MLGIWGVMNTFKMVDGSVELNTVLVYVLG